MLQQPIVWSTWVLLRPRISKFKLQGVVWDSVNTEHERIGDLLSMPRQGQSMRQRRGSIVAPHLGQVHDFNWSDFRDEYVL